MGVGIDESGSDRETVHWNDSPGLDSGEVPDGFDPLPGDSQVGGNGRRSRAVEELSAGEDEVEGHGAETPRRGVGDASRGAGFMRGWSGLTASQQSAAVNCVAAMR